MGGVVAKSQVVFNQYADGHIACCWLEIQPVSLVALRGAYRTESEVNDILTQYFSDLAESSGMPYWRWDFENDLVLARAKGRLLFQDPP